MKKKVCDIGYSEGWRSRDSVLGRNSGGKGGTARHFGRWGSLKDRRQPSHLDLYAPRQRLSTADADSSE